MPRRNKIRPTYIKESVSSKEFRSMLCLIALIVVITLILGALVGFNFYFCYTGTLVEKGLEEKRMEAVRASENRTHSHSVEHAGPSEVEIKKRAQKFKKLHDYGYWEKREKTTREKISSMLPLFKEQTLHPEHIYSSSIFSPSLFNNDEIKTPNSPDTLSTQDEPI